MEHSLTHQMAHFIIQLAVIFLAAKVSGEITEKFFKAPGVLGELIAGMIIGPYALGGMIHIPVLGYLFPMPVEGVELCLNIPCELFALAQVSSIILLFLAGLETDLKQFFRYTYPALAVALGGVVAPFFAGAWLAVAMGFGKSIFDTTPLFIGTIMTATSVGITARVLSVMKKMDTPEGVTIMAAAVVDDILGVLLLTAVLSITTLGVFTPSVLLAVGGRALLFLAGLILVCFIISRTIDRVISFFQSAGADIVISLGLCFFAAAISEFSGLAMIIGAYIMGLALSTSKAARKLQEDMEPVYHTFVPIFFVVMGMLVDFSAMLPALVFGLLLTLLAIFTKILGSGLPALLVGFNRKGAARIGLGMLPRGEVALIVAGAGLSAGVISRDIFGVSILMTFVTTLLAPILLVPSFIRGGEGTKAGIMTRAFADTRSWDSTPYGTFGTSFQRHRIWPHATVQKWILIFVLELESVGYEKLRGIVCPTGTVLTYKQKEGTGLVSISQEDIPGRSETSVRLTSSTRDLDEMIARTDKTYNREACVTFLGSPNDTE